MVREEMTARDFIEVAQDIYRKAGRQRGYAISETEDGFMADRIRFIEGTYKPYGKTIQAGSETELIVLIENDRKFWNLGARTNGEKEAPKLTVHGAEEQARNRLLQNLIDKMEESRNGNHVCAWVQPWTTGPRRPVNWETGKPYSGINLLLLPPGEYIPCGKFSTMQERNEDLKVIREKKYAILFAQRKTIEDDKDEENNGKTYWVHRTYQLRNIVDLKGIESKFSKTDYTHTESEKTAIADDMIKAYTEANDIILVERDGEAYLQTNEKTIYAPPKKSFEIIDEYYSTIFHELIHSTGTLKETRREMAGSRKSSSYAKEELIAEMGSAILCQELGLVESSTFENSTEYLIGWYEKIKAEKASFTVSAASQANKAADVILAHRETS